MAGENERAQRREAARAERKAERRRRIAESRASRARRLPNLPLLVPSLLGAALAGYLAAVYWLDASPVACGPGSGCSLVQSSRYASFLGVPTAAWGLAAYLGLAVTALAVRPPRLHWTLAILLSATGLAVSLFLTAVSIFEIRAACPWCLASLLLVGVCFGVALAQRPPELAAGTARRAFGAAAVASVLVVGGLTLHYQGAFDPAAGPEDPRLRALAEHLNETGARFYGASWCSHCAQQKELFGSSAHRLDYVECSPGGPRTPQAQVCQEAGIDAYPTWVIDGQRYEGLLDPRRLARLSGFSWPGAENEAERASPETSSG